MVDSRHICIAIYIANVYKFWNDEQRFGDNELLLNCEKEIRNVELITVPRCADVYLTSAVSPNESAYSRPRNILVPI